MLTFHEIVEFCKAEAIAGKFYPTEQTDFRWFCREYSKLFHTPLHLVMEMAPEHVILAVFEDQLEMKNMEKDEDVQSLITSIRRIEDPNYDAAEEKKMSDFVAAVEKAEKERIATGAGIPHPKRSKMRPPANKKDADFTPQKEPPKHGFIDLSYLENDDNEK